MMHRHIVGMNLRLTLIFFYRFIWSNYVFVSARILDDIRRYPAVQFIGLFIYFIFYRENAKKDPLGIP
jgi:hypothetical protein